MKNFFKTLLASTLGVIIGSAILSLFAIMIFAGIIAGMGSSSTYSLKDQTVLSIDLEGILNERSASNPLDKILGNPSSIGLDDILDAIQKAKENDEVKGIYLKAGQFNGGLANLEPIRNALIDFKETGKFIVAYGDFYAQDTYYLASVADKIILNPKGSLDFHGLSSNLTFTKNMTDKLGIKMQVFKVGTFKSAVEPLIQEKMSDANRLQRTSYLNDIWAHLLKGISDSRNIPVAKLNEYADKFLMFTEADSLINYQMVDTLLYTPAVESYLKQLVNVEESKDLHMATVENMVNVKSKTKENKDNEIAILYAEGTIVDDAANNLFSGGSTITAKEYVKELNKLKNDDKVKAVVFRVNSPGGSAYASEQIWNAVKELKAKKPVIVSMGDYAASGGYYISCAANTIVAEPTTLTGSIGIFGIIPDGEELAKKIGLSFDEVNTNKHSSFGGAPYSIPFLLTASSRGFNDEESRILQKYIENGYDLFISRCADGRNKTKADIDSIGQGRVWTGAQALEIGLVDKLGGLDTAIALAVEQAKVTEYSTAKYPVKKDMFSQIFEESMNNSKIKAIKFFMGETGYNQNVTRNYLQTFDIRSAMITEQVSY